VKDVEAGLADEVATEITALGGELREALEAPPPARWK